MNGVCVRACVGMYVHVYGVHGVYMCVVCMCACMRMVCMVYVCVHVVFVCVCMVCDMLWSLSRFESRWFSTYA